MKLIQKIAQFIFTPLYKKKLYIVELNLKEILVTQAYQQAGKLHLKNISRRALNSSEITPHLLGNMTAINEHLSFHINKGHSRSIKIIASLPLLKDMNFQRKKLALFQAALALSKHGFIVDQIVSQSLVKKQRRAPSKHTRHDECPSLPKDNELSYFLLKNYPVAGKWIILTVFSSLASLLFVTFSYNHVANRKQTIHQASKKLDGLDKKVEAKIKAAQAIKKNHENLKRAFNKINKRIKTSDAYRSLIIAIAHAMPDNCRLEKIAIQPKKSGESPNPLTLILYGITRRPEEISELIQKLMEKYKTARFSLESIERSKKQSMQSNNAWADYSFLIKGAIQPHSTSSAQPTNKPNDT